MGCDIHGAIEGLTDGGHGWMAYVAHLDTIVGRNYDTFGSLFGVRNGANFEPLFTDRGFPAVDTMSWKLRRQLDRWGAINDDGDTRYLQRVTLTRRSAMSDAWKWVLFSLMPSCATRWGHENVRLTVWFDN